MLKRISRANILAVLMLGCGVLAFAQIRPEITTQPKKPPARQRPARPTQILVQTSPNALVYLDYVFKGKASREGRLVIASPNPGDHTLRISLAGKRIYEQRVTVVAGEAKKVTAMLSDLAGKLRVRTSPGAEVFLDNQSRGKADGAGELLLADITPGVHAVRVSAPGKKVIGQSITVTAGKEATMEARLADLDLVAGTVRENPKDELKHVWIPPATFQMGCSPGDNECNNNEKPSHGVTLNKGFWMGQTEVTVGAYKRYARETGKAMPPAPTISEDRPLISGWSNEAMPMINVRWDDGQEYCKWAAGRLPTEAEWEYAARAGSTQGRYGPLSEVAWTFGNSGFRMHEVGQRRPNAWGLFDMLGNVNEWVSDWYEPNYYQNSPASDLQGPSGGQQRVLRGGSWLHRERYVRLSSRAYSPPDIRVFDIGFRCVAEVISP